MDGRTRSVPRALSTRRASSAAGQPPTTARRVARRDPASRQDRALDQRATSRSPPLRGEPAVAGRRVSGPSGPTAHRDSLQRPRDDLLGPPGGSAPAGPSPGPEPPAPATDPPPPPRAVGPKSVGPTAPTPPR